MKALVHDGNGHIALEYYAPSRSCNPQPTQLSA